MTLQEAARIGKPFKRPSHSRYITKYDGMESLTIEDILATDWKIEEKRTSVSASEIREIVEDWAQDDNRMELSAFLIKRIGLE